MIGDSARPSERECSPRPGRQTGWLHTKRGRHFPLGDDSGGSDSGGEKSLGNHPNQPTPNELAQDKWMKVANSDDDGSAEAEEVHDKLYN